MLDALLFGSFTYEFWPSCPRVLIHPHTPLDECILSFRFSRKEGLRELSGVRVFWILIPY